MQNSSLSGVHRCHDRRSHPDWHMLRVWRRRRLARNILFTVCAVYEPANMRKMLYGTLLKLICLCILGLIGRESLASCQCWFWIIIRLTWRIPNDHPFRWTRLLGLLDSVGGYESHLSDRLEFRRRCLWLPHNSCITTQCRIFSAGFWMMQNNEFRVAYECERNKCFLMQMYHVIE